MDDNPRHRLCYRRSAEGYSCNNESGHTGPCSRVLWRDSGQHKRVYWWPGRDASETLDFVKQPRSPT